jgi:hypothetical protein
MPRQEFQIHLLNETGLAKANALGDILSDALDKIEAIVPAGRDRSLVITKLQEAGFFAKRGMATCRSVEDDGFVNQKSETK